MSRQKGSANLAASLEVQAEAPLDARTVVALKSDLTNALNFPYAYVGMPVFVKEESKLYTLTAADVTTLSNWKEVGGGGSTVDGVVEYVNTLDFVEPDDVLYRLKAESPICASIQIEIPIGIQGMAQRDVITLMKDTIETSSDGALSYEGYDTDDTTGVLSLGFAVTSGRSLYAVNEYETVTRALQNGGMAHISLLEIEVCQPEHYINLKLIGYCIGSGSAFGRTIKVPLHQENNIPMTSNVSDTHEITVYTETNGLMLSIPLDFFYSNDTHEMYEHYRDLLYSALNEMNESGKQPISILQFDGVYSDDPETTAGIYCLITNSEDLLKGIPLRIAYDSVSEINGAVRVLIACQYEQNDYRDYYIRFLDSNGNQLLQLDYLIKSDNMLPGGVYAYSPYKLYTDEDTVWLGKSGSGLTKLATEDDISELQSDISELQSNFQAGVDSVYNALDAKGLTPSSESLSDVVSKISGIRPGATILGGSSGSTTHNFTNVKYGDYIILIHYQYNTSVSPTNIPSTLTQVKKFDYSSTRTNAIFYMANVDISSLSINTTYATFALHITVNSN